VLAGSYQDPGASWTDSGKPGEVRFGRPISPPFGNPVSMKTVYRVWAEAREKALTKQQVASSLAARPYDLRHACVSTWLEAGVPTARVAAWAGHSVAVLHRVYAACLDGREDEARRRVDAFREGYGTSD
jgi:integrase